MGHAGKAAAGPEAVQRLALDTLAQVELGSLDRLLAFVNECVLPMLANAEAVSIRRAAAQAATCVLRRYLVGQHPGPKNGHAATKVRPFRVAQPVLDPYRWQKYQSEWQCSHAGNLLHSRAAGEATGWSIISLPYT